MARTKAFNQAETFEKALALFWRKGYDATSMQDLVDNLGISRSSIYDTFGDKRQLFLQALEAYRMRSSEVLIETLKNHPDPKAAFSEILGNAIRQTAADTEGKGCFMANSTVELANYDEEIADIARENKGRVVGAFTEAIRRGQRAGSISKKYPATQLAEFIFATYNGLQVIGKFDRDERKLKQSVRLALSLLD